METKEDRNPTRLRIDRLRGSLAVLVAVELFLACSGDGGGGGDCFSIGPGPLFAQPEAGSPRLADSELATTRPVHRHAGDYELDPSPPDFGAGDLEGWLEGDSGAVTAVAAGDGHGCALLDTGEVLCWEDSRREQLADLEDLVAISDGQVNDIAAEGEYTCALLTTGDTWCWGDGEPGDVLEQLADASSGPLVEQLAHNQLPLDQELIPDESAAIELPDLAIAVAVGADHACALLESLEIYCWRRDALAAESLMFDQPSFDLGETLG